MKIKFCMTTVIVVLIGFNSQCLSQTLKSGIVNSNNPNLNPDWKWYENNGALEMWYAGQSAIIPIDKPVYLPFFDGGEELCAISGEKDMYPEDGWMLVCRDFGTPEEAPDQPFFVLYNINSGMLRFIFYNAQQTNYTLYKAELSFKSESQTEPILTFTDDNKPFLNDYDNTKKEVFMGEAARFDGWYYADFNLFGYNPDFDKNMQIRIRVHGVDKSAISIEGDLSIDQILDDANLSASDGVDITSLKEGFEKGAKQYKGAEKFVKGIKERVTKEQKKIDAGGKEPWWFDAASKITTVGKYIPYAGAIIGFINTAFFSDDKTSKKPLKFEGSLSLNGSIVQEELLFGEDFIFNPSAPLSSEYYRPVQDIPVGIFNLVSPPNLERLIWFYIDGYSVKLVLGYGFLNTFDNERQELYYVLNPNCGLELISMKAAFIYENKSPSDWYEPELFSKIFFANDDYEFPSGIGLKLVFQTKTATRNTSSEKVIYKVYPFGTIVDNNNEMNVIGYHKLIQIGNNLNLNNFQNFRYNVAHNDIIINNGFSLNVNNSDYGPYYYFIAGNSIKINPESNISPNQSVTFKIADFKDIQLKSAMSSYIVENSHIENILNFYEPEAMQSLNFQNLNINKSSTEESNSTTDVSFKSLRNDFHVSPYPNPTSGNINFKIESDKQTKCTLYLYNELGQSIYTTGLFIQQGKNEYSINYLANGMQSGFIFYKIISDSFYINSGKIIINK